MTASKRNVRYLPYVFTEHGALQAANILSSARAVQMSVFVIRAFVKMRETLLGTRELAKKLATLEKQLTGQLDANEAALVHVLSAPFLWKTWQSPDKTSPSRKSTKEPE